MDDYVQSLKEYYESKRKRKSLAVEIEKKPYYYDKDYLTFLENRLLEEKSKILIIKYNIVYNLGLDDNLEECEQIEENIKKIKEERDKIKFMIERKEERKIKEIKKLYDSIDILKLNYHQIPDIEEKKIIYAEIEIKRDEINSILNDDRCILKDSNNFTLVHDYQPIYGNEILVDSSETLESLNSENSEDSKSKKNVGQSSLDLGAEDLDKSLSFTAQSKTKPKLKFDSKYDPDNAESKGQAEPKVPNVVKAASKVESKAESKTLFETKPSKPKLKFNSNP